MAGVGRTFQTARLFQNETVFDIVRTACTTACGRRHAQPLSGLVGSPRAIAVEVRWARATQLIDQSASATYATKDAPSFFYGHAALPSWRRSSPWSRARAPRRAFVGYRQRETEALDPCCSDLRKELGATFLLIEHDIR